jgi:hypothetical protein
MQNPVSRKFRADSVAGSLLATLLLAATTTLNGAELKIQRFRIDSNPSGAEVSSIVGRVGVTPLSVSERDIYPNTYPDGKLHLYGKLIITKPGCKTVTHRVTLDDIKDGLNIKLECEEQRRTTVQANPPAEARQTPKPVRPVTPGTEPVSEPLSDRRLRQLKVLNELLEDKLISVEEEKTIRQRIFDRLGD